MYGLQPPCPQRDLSLVRVIGFRVIALQVNVVLVIVVRVKSSLIFSTTLKGQPVAPDMLAALIDAYQSSPRLNGQESVLKPIGLPCLDTFATQATRPAPPFAQSPAGHARHERVCVTFMENIPWGEFLVLNPTIETEALAPLGTSLATLLDLTVCESIAWLQPETSKAGIVTTSPLG